MFGEKADTIGNRDSDEMFQEPLKEQKDMFVYPFGFGRALI